MAATADNLDQMTIGKIKLHNKSVREKRMEEAMALREKLELWRKEKAKKMLEKKLSSSKGSQQNKAPGKFSAPSSKTQLVKQPLKSRAAATNVQKNLLPGKVSNRRTTMTLVSGARARSVTQLGKTQGSNCRASNSAPSKRPRLSVTQPCDAAVVTSKPPASRRSVGGARRGLGRIQKILHTDDSERAVAAESKEDSAEECREGKKENTETVEIRSGGQKRSDLMEQQAATENASTDAPRMPAPVLSTPLSHNSQFSVRQIVASLASRSAGASQVTEGKPAAGCHTTPVVAVHSITGVKDLSQQLVSQQKQGENLHRNSDRTFCVESDAEQMKAENTGTRKAKRDSLSAQFRKQKSQASASVMKSQSLTSAIGKSASGKTASETGSQSQNPSRSILKRKSCFPASTNNFDVGASPCLTSVRKSSSNPDQTSSASDVPGVHVKFTVEHHQDSASANFRKTPAAVSKDRKTQEGLRARLNEWRASKVHTPNARHACCFNTDGFSASKPTPRSQVKPSITVEQLSKQENTLVQEELKKNLFPNCNTTPSQHPATSTVTVRWTPKTPTLVPAASHQESCGTNVSTSKMDVSWESYADGPDAHQLTNAKDGEGGMAAAPQFDTDSWDISRLEQDFDKCQAALESESLSADAALGWLDSIQEAFSDVKVYIGWYKCRVLAHKMLGDSDAVLNDFEQAILNSVQPAEEMANLLTQTMRDMLTWQTKGRKGRKSATSAPKSAQRTSTSSTTRKRRPSQAEVQEENMFESTTVKYSVVEVTPFRKRRRMTEVGDKIVPVITPVRRSARISMAVSKGRPKGTGHGTEYTALRDVPSAEKEKMLFQPNKALDILLPEDSPSEGVSYSETPPE